MAAEPSSPEVKRVTGQHRLEPVVVAGVAAVPACRVMAVVTEVIGELALERGLQQPLGQLLQQPILAVQLQPVRAGSGGQPAISCSSTSSNPCRRSPGPFESSAVTSVIDAISMIRSYTDLPEVPSETTGSYSGSCALPR